MQPTGPHPYSFWLSRSAVGTKYLSYKTNSLETARNSLGGRGLWRSTALGSDLLWRVSAFSSQGARAEAIHWKCQEGICYPAPCCNGLLFYPVSALFGLSLASQGSGSKRGPLATVLPTKASRWRFKLISACFFGLKCQGWPNLICSVCTSCKMLGWMNHKLESRLPGKISTTSDMQMRPL